MKWIWIYPTFTVNTVLITRKYSHIKISTHFWILFSSWCYIFAYKSWKHVKKDMFYIRFLSECKYLVPAKQFSYLISPPSDQTVIILTNYQAMLKYGEGRVRDAEGMFVSSDKLTITVRWSGCAANYRCRPAKALQTNWLRLSLV